MTNSARKVLAPYFIFYAHIITKKFADIGARISALENINRRLYRLIAQIAKSSPQCSEDLDKLVPFLLLNHDSVEALIEI